MIKNVVAFVFSSQARLPLELFCYIASRSASRACCLLKSIAIMLKYLLKQL